MDRLSNLIINKLKTGTIENVILFSDVDTFPEPPYVVVKTESGIMPNTRNYRIITHMQKGQADELEDYAFKELDDLLLSDYLIDDEGGRYKLYSNGYTDVTAEKEDNSYFMERIFYTPLMIRG